MLLFDLSAAICSFRQDMQMNSNLIDGKHSMLTKRTSIAIERGHSMPSGFVGLPLTMMMCLYHRDTLAGCWISPVKATFLIVKINPRISRRDAIMYLFAFLKTIDATGGDGWRAAGYAISQRDWI